MKADATGAGTPFTNTEAPLHTIGSLPFGPVGTQLDVATAPPRFDPEIDTSIPGAIGPAVCDAVWTIEAAVNEGV